MYSQYIVIFILHHRHVVMDDGTTPAEKGREERDVSGRGLDQQHRYMWKYLATTKWGVTTVEYSTLFKLNL